MAMLKTVVATAAVASAQFCNRIDYSFVNGEVVGTCEASTSTATTPYCAASFEDFFCTECVAGSEASPLWGGFLPFVKKCAAPAGSCGHFFADQTPGAYAGCKKCVGPTCTECYPGYKYAGGRCDPETPTTGCRKGTAQAKNCKKCQNALPNPTCVECDDSQLSMVHNGLCVNKLFASNMGALNSVAKTQKKAPTTGLLGSTGAKGNATETKEPKVDVAALKAEVTKAQATAPKLKETPAPKDNATVAKVNATTVAPKAANLTEPKKNVTDVKKNETVAPKKTETVAAKKNVTAERKLQDNSTTTGASTAAPASTGASTTEASSSTAGASTTMSGSTTASAGSTEAGASSSASGSTESSSTEESSTTASNAYVVGASAVLLALMA